MTDSRHAGAVFARIVCGVDGSPEGLEAVRQARRLAGSDSKFTLVGVSETHLAVHAGFEAAKWVDRLNDDAEAALAEALTAAEGAEHASCTAVPPMCWSAVAG
jgi:nucleotide-binding universal stress UspA family protein